MTNKLWAVLPLLAASVSCTPEHLNTPTAQEYIVDFKDSTTPAQIAKLESDTGLKFEHHSIEFAKTKITHATIDSRDFAKDRKLLNDSGLLENLETVQYYSVEDPGNTDEDITEDIDQANGGCSKFADGPNDPLYKEGKQWNMTSIGVEQAWKTTRGKGAIVAVLDTGISTGAGKYPRVPDLKSTCMVEGYNFVSDDKDPYDWHGHGTHVGGTIAQSTNNGIGVVGIAYEACLMPVKVLGDDGSGRTDDIAEAIIWATDNGANVINMSLGGGGYSKVMADAVKYAADHNVFVACAAGNSGRATIEYPAAMPGCHAVSAVGKAGNLSFYSSHGTNGGGLFIAAPGGDQRADGQEGGIWQDTILDGQPTKHGYFPFQGTSMATPHVAGVAALVYAELGPEKTTVAQVETALRKSATPKDGKDKYGAGLLNAERAVKVAAEEQPLVEGGSHYTAWLAGLLGLFGLFGFLKIRRS